MRRFAELCERVAATSAKNEKVDLVAAYLRSVPVGKPVTQRYSFAAGSSRAGRNGRFRSVGPPFGRLSSKSLVSPKSACRRSTGRTAIWATWPRRSCRRI